MTIIERVALVTGGGAGMGEATCHRLARDGKLVAVLDIDAANAQKVAASINEAGGKAMAVSADISRRDHIERAVEAIHNTFGAISVLVNNAGVEDFAAFDAIDSDQWHRMLNINLTGNYNVTQAVLPDMVAQQRGRIINFSSISAQTGAANMVHYAAATQAVEDRTELLAETLEHAHSFTQTTTAPMREHSRISGAPLDSATVPDQSGPGFQFPFECAGYTQRRGASQTAHVAVTGIAGGGQTGGQIPRSPGSSGGCARRV